MYTSMCYIVVLHMDLYVYTYFIYISLAVGVIHRISLLVIFLIFFKEQVNESKINFNEIAFGYR